MLSDGLLPVEEYLGIALSQGATDLHLCPKSPPGMRVGGKMRPVVDLLLTPEDTKYLVMSLLNEKQTAQLEESLSVDFILQGDTGRFRGNAHYTINGLELALRYLPTTVPSLMELGHWPAVEKLCNLRQGLVLITGLAGAGKTTTLASMVRMISKIRSGVIVTVEDPVEYLIGHAAALVKQREVGTTASDYPSALKEALRQDPNVLVISELRDVEAARVAMRAADTGHLVITTLHTTDAPGAINRIIGMFPGSEQAEVRLQLSTILRAVLCQHLLPKKGQFGERVLATELLKVEDAARVAIRDHKPNRLLDAMQLGRRHGMFSLDESLKDLVRKGLVDLDDALAICRDPEQVVPEELADSARNG